jgi:hypothetical protein
MDEQKKYIPMEFPIDIQLRAVVGATAKGSVALNNRPFVLQKIKHQIIIVPFDPATQNLFNLQHGLYRIDWSIHETARFWKGTAPPMADTYGSVRHGIWDELPAPLAIDGNDTIYCQLTSEFAAGAPPGTLYTVQVKFCGVERVL